MKQKYVDIPIPENVRKVSLKQRSGREGWDSIRDVSVRDRVYIIKTYSCASCSISRGSGVGWSLRLFARREKSELSEASDLELDTRDLRGELDSVVTRLGVVSALNMNHAIEGEMGGHRVTLYGQWEQTMSVVLS